METLIPSNQTARFNSTQYIRDWTRLHHSIEQQLYPLFKAALSVQTNSAKQYIELNGITGLSQHLTVLISKQPMQVAYLSAYQKAGVRGAEFSYNSIQRTGQRKSAEDFEIKEIDRALFETKSIGFFSDYWRKLMSLFYSTDAAIRVQQVTETTRNEIQQLLDNANNQGLTQSETATYLTKELNDPDFNRMRALRIARTESTTAANHGASLGNESADYVTVKKWLAVLDQNTRPDHIEANGQTVQNDELFNIGGNGAMYPGDISLPANEVINCRCTLAYIPVLDGSGLPILK